MEEGVVVGGAVGAREVVVANTIPSGHIACVGMTVVMDVAGTSVDGLFQRGTTPVALFFVEFGEVVADRIAGGGITVVVMGADKQLEIVRTVGSGVVVKMLTSQDDFVELAQYRGLLVGESLVNHVLKVSGSLERHAANADLRQQVVFARLAPKVVAISIPVAIQSAKVEVGRDAIVFLVATS